MSDDHQFNEPKRAPLTPDDIEGTLSKAAFAMAFALAEIKSLRSSHDALLAAAKEVMHASIMSDDSFGKSLHALQAAIAKAEEFA